MKKEISEIEKDLKRKKGEEPTIEAVILVVVIVLIVLILILKGIGLV